MHRQIQHKPLLFTLLLVSMSLPFAGTAAVEQAANKVESMKLNISDLDLNQQEGIVTLYNRLKNNVGKVCGAKYTQVTGSRTAASKIKKQHKKCSIEALDNAVKSINNARLTELHTQSTL